MSVPGGRQSGQTLVIFAIVLAFVLVGMLALIADLGSLFTSYTRASDAALLAAQAGAAQINQDAYYHQRLELDTEQARNACQTVIDDSHFPGGGSHCSATTEEVTAYVVFDTQLPIPLPTGSARISVRHTAVGVYGQNTGTRST